MSEALAEFEQDPGWAEHRKRLLGSDTDFAAVHSHRTRRASHRLGEFGL